MYATVSMIYVVDFCRSFHASDATQNRPCEPVVAKTKTPENEDLRPKTRKRRPET